METDNRQDKLVNYTLYYIVISVKEKNKGGKADLSSGRSLTDFFKEHQGGQCDWSNVNKGSSSRRSDKRGDKGPEHIDSCFYF